MVDRITGAAREVHTMRARCAKSLGDVPKQRSGTYLFNYFVAEDPAVLSELCDHLAGWYQQHTGLDNSTLLEPLEADGFAFVNHARWDKSLSRVMLEQFRRASFCSMCWATC